MLSYKYRKNVVGLVLALFIFAMLSQPISQIVFAQANENITYEVVYASVSKTFDNLYASVQGETNAAAAYRAFADKAEEEGYRTVANLFRATADAETKHADDEWNILQGMGVVERPTAAIPTVGSIAT
jgi:ferritin